MLPREMLPKETVKVVNTAIKKSSKKHVGIFLILIGVAVLIIGIGYAVTIAFQNYNAKVKIGNDKEVSISFEK